MKIRITIPLCCVIIGAIFTLLATNIQVAKADELSTTSNSYNGSSTSTELNNESTSNADLIVDIALRNLDDGTITNADSFELEAGKTYELIYAFKVVLIDDKPCKCQEEYRYCDYCDYDETCYNCDCNNISKVVENARTRIILPEIIWANHATNAKGIFWGDGARQEITSHTASLTANTSLYLKPVQKIKKDSDIMLATSATGFLAWKVRPDSPVTFSYAFTAEKISIFNIDSMLYFIGKIFSGQSIWNAIIIVLILLVISAAIPISKRAIRVLKSRRKLRHRKRVRKHREYKRPPKIKIENLDDES